MKYKNLNLLYCICCKRKSLLDNLKMQSMQNTKKPFKQQLCLTTNLIDFRLFCKPEDEQSTPSEGVIQARERGLRSSSETSVFDFRESDSDGETASERQSLHEMRKDRDRRLQEKHQNIPASSLDPTSDLVEVLIVINCCLSFNLSYGEQLVLYISPSSEGYSQQYLSSSFLL